MSEGILTRIAGDLPSPSPERKRKRIVSQDSDSDSDISSDSSDSSSEEHNPPAPERARTSFKWVEKKLNKRIEYLLQKLGNANANLESHKEKITELESIADAQRERIRVLQREVDKLTVKTNIPEFYPNTKREIECLENNGMMLQRQRTIDIENMDGDNLMKLTKALEADWKLMHKLEVQNILEGDKIAKEFQCSMNQSTVETALMGPDHYVYDVRALHRYVETNQLTVFFVKDVSGAEYMRIPEWRSPNTRQVFQDATFRVDHRAHNILNHIRDDISQDLARDFFKDMQSYIHPKTMNMQKIAELFGKPIVQE